MIFHYIQITLQQFSIYRKMGNQCLASTPMQHYQTYFENVKTSEIKDYWTTIQVYKIKTLFDGVASKHPQFKKHTHLQFQQFVNLFPELQKYQERQKLRVFQIFNFDGHGLIDWNNFYSMISICYFASEQILAVIMFLIFDESLSKELTRAQVQMMCECNQSCIVTKQQSGEQIPIYDPYEVVEHLLTNRQSLSIKAWLTDFRAYFSMNKFRRIFNIFVEEKLEKQLIKHFNQWNNLYLPEEDRYVSYLIDFKWFESWKIYVKHQYGFCLSTSNKKPVTFKTKKMFKSNFQVNGMKKIADALTLRELKFQDKPSKPIRASGQQQDCPQQIKNFDFIHSNIGDKPKQIYNKVLQGDFQQVLKQDIIENRDYVLISEKVWKTLKRIYQGYPQFRRTGFDFIELYPKILRILPFKKGLIKYNQQNIKEVSAYYAVQDVLEAIFTKPEVQNKKFYFKSFGIKKWQEITDLTTALAELTTEVIIYIAVVPSNEADIFDKKHTKLPRDISEINVGDQIKFQHPIRKIEQTMVFLGKNVEGKYILHVPGQSYIYDICVMEFDLLKKGQYCQADQKSLQSVKIKKKQDLGLIGIPNGRGLGYINSTIMHLYYNWGFKQQLSLANLPEEENNEEKSLLLTIAKIFKELTNKRKINTKIISQTIEEVLPDFNQFSADLCNQFFNQFYRQIASQLTKRNMKNNLELHLIKSQKTLHCRKCNNITNQSEEKYSLSLPLHNNTQKYYEIIFVPFCQNMNGGEMKKYGFKLRVGANLKQYKDAFETVVGLKGENKQYLLMEVYANSIVKNYSTAKNEASLDELLLRDTDTIVAYQLKLDFGDFIAKHYAQNIDFDNNEIKIDQFIDCKNSTRGWIFGKVCQKDFTPYGHRTIVRVVHKFSKGQQWQISYDVDDESVANFPTMSYLNGQQFHLRLQQRYFNQASNDMQICNMPLVVVLTNWMRWREFYYMIFLQMRKFINDQQQQYRQFEQENQHQNDFQIYSSKSIGSKNRKKTNKIKLNKFKDFLYGPNFPYKLNFVDYSGRCAICFKFLKSQVFQGENETYCSGCQLSTSQPISWQIKVADVMVCVDWKKLDSFKKDIVKDHSSYANMVLQKKNDVQTLENCLKTIEEGYSQNIQQICCNTETQVTIKQRILQLPQNLTIYLQRIIEQNGFIKIMNKHVRFEETLKVGEYVYTLIGLTSIEGGSNKSTKYRTFVLMSGDEWLQYDGNVVRAIKKHYIQKLCVLNLYYKRKQIE